MQSFDIRSYISVSTIAWSRIGEQNFPPEIWTRCHWSAEFSNVGLSVSSGNFHPNFATIQCYGSLTMKNTPTGTINFSTLIRNCTDELFPKRLAIKCISACLYRMPYRMSGFGPLLISTAEPINYWHSIHKWFSHNGLYKLQESGLLSQHLYYK